MKGINLKKIGAIVAGATILASSVAFAGLMYGNTVLVDDNGQPVAKVVLGGTAAPSDGVVAAAIAAKIASAAYKKTTLTAAVPSDATGTCGATGAGTCAISNEKVTLEVTVPGGTSEGVHEFSTLIGDYIDKKLKNRENTNPEDVYNTTLSETSDDANPFDLGTGAIRTDKVDLYKVDSDVFTPFATKTITDSQTGDTYDETQSMWISGTTEFAASDAKVEFKPELLVYQVKFDDSTHTGIPVCTDDINGSKNYADCDDNSDSTGRHRVKISFLGSDWIISDMDPETNANVTSTSEAISDDGTVTLAKESIYGIVNVGESIESADGQLNIKLDDISVSNLHEAIVTFTGPNGESYGQDQIVPSATLKKTIGGKTYKIKVYQTAPGYTFGAKWAEMALLENELVLSDDEAIDDADNEDWNTELVWKNREAGTDAPDADALRAIVLYRESYTFTGDNVAMVSGESVNVIEDPVAYKLTYKGLDLVDSDYDTLKYQTGDGQNIKVDYQNGTVSTVTLGDYIKVTSQDESAFEGSGGQGDTLYYTCPDTGVLNASTTIDCDGTTGEAVYLIKKTTTDNVYYISANITDSGLRVNYADAGESSYNTGVEFIPDASPVINLIEDVGAVGVVEHNLGTFGVKYNNDTSEFESSGGSDADDSVNYTVAGMPSSSYASSADYEEGEFISPRGSEFDDISSTSVTFKVATKVGEAAYEFATAEAAETGASTTQVTLGEGETTTVSDVIIKVKSIDETVGACAASGGSATCTVPKAQISAVIMPNNMASVEAIIPYAVNPNLVVLDKDAATLTATTLITVGGDKVNSVTAETIAGSDVDFAATNVVVKEFAAAKRIVVAGLSAQNTIDAGTQFLAAVQAN